ncbi:hypothetical protein AWM70_07600 [Paenibacillus yonginensis]|uniref:Uncharacterized protein n=1 Tax=Paenibacillus yonginensis TaxID=1462996 RepID=A0A1B1MZ64_9BACL|nr:hypothetical protein [Paenibacillus yonginensis]ANS74464.1 hypothetical protein AWM70_07600 [Paenibacillus yonginensis]
MHWDLPLLFILAFSLIEGIWRSIKQRSLAHILGFFSIWTLALAAVIVDMMQLPGFRPLDWIGFVMQPINKFMP